MIESKQHWQSRVDHKHFTESLRLSEVKRLYSNLEENSNNNDEIQVDEIIQQQDDHIYQERGEGGATTSIAYRNGANEIQNNTMLNKRFLQKVSQFFIGRVFKINHVLLENLAITNTVYQLFLLFEFLQLMFYVFQKVDVFNEFSNLNQSSSFLNNTQTLNGTTITTVTSTAIIDYTEIVYVNISDYFVFVNFHLYSLQSGSNSSTSFFVALYLIVIGTFYLLLTFTFVAATRLFLLSKNDELKDLSKMIIKLTSLITFAYISILQIPFMSLALQGYLCQEDSDDIYILENVTCGGMFNQIMIVVSTVSLIIYTVFVIIQHSIFTSNNFETTIPWGSINTDTNLIKVLWKTLITMSFMLDKYGRVRSQLRFAIAILGGVLVYRRLISSLIYDKYVRFTTIIYDFLITWLFTCLALLSISATPVIELFDLALIIISGIFLVALILFYYEIKDFNISLRESGTFDSTRIQKTLYRLTNMCQDTDHNMTINGFIGEHLEECSIYNCACLDIVQSIEGKLYRLHLQDNNQYDEREMIKKDGSLKNDSKIQQQNTMYNQSSYEQQTSCVQLIKQRKHLLSREESKDINFSLHMSLSNIQPIEQSSNRRIEAYMDCDNISNIQQLESVKTPMNEFDMSFKPIINQKDQDQAPPYVQYVNKKKNELQLPLSLIDGQNKKKSSRPRRESFIDIMNFSKIGKMIRTQPIIHEKVARNIIGEPDLIMPNEQSMRQDDPNKMNDQSNNQVDPNQEAFDDELIEKGEALLKYRFLSLLIEKAIKKQPKSVDLRLHSAQIQTQRLQNEFKAVFELMQCDILAPNLQQRFFIFRRRITLQRKIIYKNTRTTQVNEGIDPMQVYNFEKLYQRFLKYSYFAANSALAFWRELMQRNIDSQALQERGTEISKNYDRIQDISTQISKIVPNDIKFILNYATFLKQIVHNDYEAQILYQKAMHLYQILLPFKRNRVLASGGDNGSQEKALYGDNSALGMLMVGLSAERVGNIIHTNEEIKRILGFERSQLIDQNMNVLLPSSITLQHDKFMRSFLETNRIKRLNQVFQTYALTQDGYLRPVTILLKLYPQMQDKIIIIAFLQHLDKIDGLEPPRQLNGMSQEDGAAKLPHHYILVDQAGFISCVSEGLFSELGLNSKFFNNRNSVEPHSNQVHIESLFDQPLTSIDMQEQILSSDGLETNINTKGIQALINIESVSRKEAQVTASKQGLHPVHIQVRRYVFDPQHCIIDLYRIILLPKINDRISDLYQGNSYDGGSLKKINQNNARITESGESYEKQQMRGTQNTQDKHSYESSDNHQFEILSMSGSASSAGSDLNKLAYSNSIQEFKNIIEKRDTPRRLILMSRTITLILLLTIIITGVDYSIKSTYSSDSKELTDLLVYGQSRTIELLQTVQDVRSFINVANGIEFQTFGNEQLKRIDRFAYLRQLIYSENEHLQQANEYISLERTQDGSSEQTRFESKLIDLDQVSSYDTYSISKLPYRQSLTNFMNNLLELNVTNRSQLQIPDYLLKGMPSNTTSRGARNVTQMEKQLFFILANGLRSIRERTQEVEKHLTEQVDQFTSNQGVSSMLAVMILGVTISVTFLVIAVSQILYNERSKQETMSIFALFTQCQIKAVYEVCNKYLERIDKQDDEDMINLQESLVVSNKSPNKQQNGPHVQLSINEDSEHNGLTNTQLNNQVIASQPENQIRSAQSVMTIRTYYAGILQKTLAALLETNYQRASSIIPNKFHDQAKQSLKSKKTMRILKVASIDSTDNIEKPSKKGKIYNKVVFGVKAKIMPDNYDIKQQLKNKKLQKKFAIGRIEPLEQTTSKLKPEEESKNNDSELSSRNNDESILNYQAEKKQNDEEIHENLQNERKVMLKTSSRQRKRRFFHAILLNALVVMIFNAFFVYTYVFHKVQLQTLRDIQGYTPLFFDRYQYLYLSYQLLREKIVNEKLNYEQIGFFLPENHRDELYQQNIEIDQYYHEKSMEVENKISKLKVTRPPGLGPLLDYSSLIDSEGLCNDVFAIFKGNKEEKVSITKNAEAKLKKIRREAYQFQIDTVIAACNAASAGDLATVIKLRERGVDLNVGDYDNRTPLHVSAGGGQFEVVKYLLEQGVIVSPVDRWGACPLNDAIPFPNIDAILRQYGAQYGKPQNPYKSFSVTVNDDQFRLYYAAFYGNVAIMENLRLLGWDVNGQDYDGRTALGVAASEGQLEVVKYLISKGADLAIKDARGNDPLDDARRQNRSSTVDYLINEALIRNFCNDFEDGLLTKGLAPAIGIFNRKFSDLSISVDRINSPVELLTILGGTHPRKLNSTKIANLTETTSNTTSNFTTDIKSPTHRILQVFLATQELYLFKVLDLQLSALKQTFSDYQISYMSYAQIAFYIFIIIQLFTLIVLRKKFIDGLTEDIMQSRGILNIVPPGFFKENQHAVEKAINMMKE